MTQAPAAPEAPAQSLLAGVRQRAADFWIWMLSAWSARWPRLLAVFTPMFLRAAWRCSPSIRKATMANARRILGDQSTPNEREALGRGVLHHFFLFVAELGRHSRRDWKGMLTEIERVEGHEHYERARSSKRGAIIAVAHMGSFEIGVASLRRHEEHIHVVFQRDNRAFFEKMRQRLHQRLGVHEATLDEGWPLWYRLREALQRDEVVLIQADRVMPGHKGVPIPFLHGHIEMPTGPVKLAIASGSPIIPVFALRTPSGRIRIVVEEAIETGTAPAPGKVHPAMVALSKVIERHVLRNPEQWLLFHKAWIEDKEPAQ